MKRVKQELGVINSTTKAGSNGITVAVLDSGIAYHPDLSDHIYLYKDFVDAKRYPEDPNGHGTHVCGIIGGNGRLSGGDYSGICPNVKFQVARILDRAGKGEIASLLHALQWVELTMQENHIRIVNISVGIDQPLNKEQEAKCIDIIKGLWEKGVLIVCAAGNSGPEANTISTLASMKQVLTVGCFEDDKRFPGEQCCQRYSGRGDMKALELKPDLVAQGMDIYSCNNQYRRIPYVKKSGTSMSAAIVSGVCARLMENYPALNNETCKKYLQFTAKDCGLPWNQQGWGKINISAEKSSDYPFY